MITALTALLLASAEAPACSLAHVEQCSGTWELIGRSDFKRELRRFLGRGKANWVYPAEKTEQVLLMLSVSDDGPLVLPDGTISMGGCFPHNCPERANVFFAPSGEIRAIALLYHDCAAMACTGDENYTLRILVRERTSLMEAHAREWASGELHREAETFAWADPKLDNTLVEVLKD